MLNFLHSAWRQAPISLSLIFIACLVTLAMEKFLGASVFYWLAFTPLGVLNQQIVSMPLEITLISGQWWRLVTPIFLHFGLIHLVFNCLWIWEFGRHLEAKFGSVKILFIALIIALVSNYAQYFTQGSQFGGLSGVVYGYLGYFWLSARLRPKLGLFMNQTLMLFMLGWMLFGITGLAKLLGINMANAAHLGGLLTGMLCALYPLKPKF